MNNSFKQVFISPKNSGYLFDLIISRVLKNNPEYQQIIFLNIHSYKSNLIDVQTYIFDDTFYKIYNSNDNVDFEEILNEEFDNELNVVIDTIFKMEN